MSRSGNPSAQKTGGVYGRADRAEDDARCMFVDFHPVGHFWMEINTATACILARFFGAYSDS